jgi:DNA-binding NarL/FixJ family response regulator
MLGPDHRRLKLLIVDDHEVVREGLVAALREDTRYEVVGSVGDGRAALECARRELPDIILLDLRLPDVEGAALCRRFRKGFPSTAVVILSTYLSEGTVRSALEAGAAAYVTKAAGLPELKSTLERVAVRGPGAAHESAPQIVEYLHRLVSSRMDVSQPTPQQGRVLELAAQGLTNKEIGARLYVSESTVRFHIQKLKEKVGAHTKTELIAKSIRTGLISPAYEDTPAPETEIR